MIALGGVGPIIVELLAVAQVNDLDLGLISNQVSLQLVLGLGEVKFEVVGAVLHFHHRKVEHDVVGLQVPVHHLLLIEGLEPLSQLPSKEGGVSLREEPVGLDHLLESVAVVVLGQDHGLVLGVENLVELDHVFVLDVAHIYDLALEVLLLHGVPPGLGEPLEQVEGLLPLKVLHVHANVDLGLHALVAQLLDDVVSVSNEIVDAHAPRLTLHLGHHVAPVSLGGHRMVQISTDLLHLSLRLLIWVIRVKQHLIFILLLVNFNLLMLTWKISNFRAGGSRE
mmetsp:Transcript_1118/g.2053  ORF Transcript_1118/g.2053 Transcript_1118/m.2053 type:complete len:281 (-) Transcript_1118:69-911(-)